MTRLALAIVAGAALASVGAVALGEYPFNGAVPWLAALVIPALVGGVMTAISRRRSRELWMLTGPLGAGSIAWGAQIATSWGLDPLPVTAWVGGTLALLWPIFWGILSARHQTVEP